MYWRVEVVDRITHDRVCVVDPAESSEAQNVVRVLKRCNACDVFVYESEVFYNRKKGDLEE